MKKAVIFVIVIISALILSVSCTQSYPNGSNTGFSGEKADELRLVGTIGPLSIPMAYLAENNSLEEVANKTTFEVWANPSQLQAILSGGQADFVSMPTNSAAIFYNRGMNLQLLDSSIWNILYIVTADTSINSISDLKDKSLLVPFQGAAPDAVLKNICQSSGLNMEKDIELVYVTDAIQASQMLLSGQYDYALLSEPSATSAIAKGSSSGLELKRALNMKTEWEKVSDGSSSTPIAGTVVLGEIAEKQEIVEVFLSEYEKAVSWMMNNPVEAGELGERALSEQGFKAEVLTASLQNIDWNFTEAADAKGDLEEYFRALSETSSDFIGGKIPDEGFYYGK
jgi:NitT/TauT family transport system substrate-binding protein